MAKWRCLHESIVRSRRLRTLSFHDRLVYTWGIAVLDAWGVIRRDDLMLAVFPRGGSTRRRVELAIDRLVDLKLVCRQEHEGDAYLHWCKWEKWQGELVRKGRGAPPFLFCCHNESDRAVKRDEARRSAVPRTTVPDRTGPRQDSDSDKTARDGAQPHPPCEEKPRSRLFEAVIARHPLAGAVYYQRYTDLEDEYGADFVWDCYLAALDSNPNPSPKYLDTIARRCKAEGRMPLEREDLRDGTREESERPTEVDGRPVAGWAGDTPIFATPAKAS